MKSVIAIKWAIRLEISDNRPYIGVKTHTESKYDVPSHEVWVEALNEDPIGVRRVAMIVPSNAERKVHVQIEKQSNQNREAGRLARL